MRWRVERIVERLPQRPRHLFLLLGISVLAVAIAVGLALAASRTAPLDEPNPIDPSRAANPSGSSPEHPHAPDVDALESLAPEADPERFVASVVHALFDWDTTVGIPPTRYRERLLLTADPTGAETPGLVADVAAYLPTDDAWSFLRRYSTRQWITSLSISVPTSWPQVDAGVEADVEVGGEVGGAGNGEVNGLSPGTAAYTVRGTRHRAGLWEGNDVSSTHDVAFTVFVVCGPMYPTCHLLRLSRLNEPLD